MINLVKFTISFLVVFLLLGIPVKNKTLFDLLHHSTARITTPLYNGVSSSFHHGVTWGKQLFTSAAPKISDEVKEQRSGVSKEEIAEEEPLEDLDGYTPQEKEMLDQLTK